jgi:hypothetical protein
MSEQIRQMVDPDGSLFDKVHFGRNRFLRAAGAALFGLAVRTALPRQIHAHHEAPSFPCWGYHNCNCCSGTTCCTGFGCGYWQSLGCPTGQQCWYTCTGGGQLFRCCDWREKLPNGSWDPNPCICSSWVGSC